MCMYPQFVPGWKKVFIPSYGAHSKNYGTPVSGGTTHNAKDFDNLVERECGKCPDCRKKKALGWCFRLGEEANESFTAQFLTLTYANEYLPKNNILDKGDMQLFWKNLRRQIDYLYEGDDPSFSKYGKNEWILQEQYHRMKEAHWFKEKRLKHYTIGEYGTDNGRAHHHAIAFNIPKPLIQKLPKIWGRGILKLGTVTPKSIRYVANYVQQIDLEKPRAEREYATQSNGIGEGYARKNTSYHRRRISGTVRYNGIDIPMPQYYRKKFFTDEERDHLARINEEERNIREEAQILECLKRGIDYEDYIKEENRLKWEKFNKHKKRRKL